MKDALALALVHFIWQGALLAIVGALLMRVARVPNVRYAIGVATMAAMLLAPVMTFLAIRNAAELPVAAPGQSTVTNSNAAATNDVPTRASSSVPPASNAFVPTTWILNVWAVGVLLLSLRFLGGWAVARRLATQALRPVGEELQSLAGEIAVRLNVRGAVRVCESASVAVPIMLGCLRPVIVLPPAAVVALPLAQLEALLAHEFAHIRRHDYLVNLLQTGVETLCFYHPAVWWISREVRRHREHCCDDIAVSVCDRLTYVTALSSLASISTPQLALSAAGGSLRERVRRLIEPATHSASPKGAWIAMLPILLVISFVAPQAWSTKAATPGTATTTVAVANIAVPAVAATTAADVVPVEQAKPSTAATEAARAQAKARLELEEDVRAEVRARAEAKLELEEKVRAALQEQSGTEQARVRELLEKGLLKQEGARNQEVAREITERMKVMAAEVSRAIEAGKTAQEVPPEFARGKLDLQKLALNQNELAQLESKLRLADAAMSRQKELVEKGLVTRQSLIAAEEDLRQLKLQLEQAAMMGMSAEQLELRKHELQLGHAATTHRNFTTLDANATLEAQDRLTITIDGEPDLPTMFTVRSDGSIRFPFLGTIRVQGSTTSQVQAAIRKLISDKNLARNPVVNVSASRMR